jgi:group I intron endonuclease
MFYVYKITCLVNDKVYIGKTNNPNKRWRTHKNISQHPEWSTHQLLHKAMHKHGVINFSFEIIEECNLEQHAFEREAYWITVYKCNVYKFGSDSGYNQTDGGDGVSGMVYSDEYKKKMSDAVSGEKNGFYGKTHTEQTKQLQSNIKKTYFKTHPAANLGRPATEESKKAVAKMRSEKFEFYSDINTGSKNPQAKLTEQNVEHIYSFIVSGMSDQVIADKFGVASTVITGIRIGTDWTHVSRPKELGNGRINLTKELVVKIIQSLQSGMEDIDIAAQYNVPIKRIIQIRLGQTWKNVPRPQELIDNRCKTKALTTEQIMNIKNLIKEGILTNAEIARLFSISAQYIGQIRLGHVLK